MKHNLPGKCQLKSAVSACLVAIATSFLTQPAPAASIGVHFTPSAFAPLAPTDVAGLPADAQANFTNVESAVSNLSLVDSNGAPTTATLTLANMSFGIFTSAPSGPDEKLNDGYTSSSSAAISFTLSGIPYASYSIVVYDMDQGAEQGVTIGATSYYGAGVTNGTAAGYVDGNSSTPFTYTRATSTDFESPTVQATYTEFDGLSGTAQTVTVNTIGGGVAGRFVEGFQIVPTPEPGSAAFLALGAIGLLSRRVRRSGQQPSGE